MKKVIIIFCMLVLLSSFSAFAQDERNHNITGTFGIGGGFSRMTDTSAHISFVFDLNLIHKSGFSICFTYVAGINPIHGSFQNILVGPGYHYFWDNWYIGTAVLFSPMALDMMFGGKIIGGYYFSNNIGITGMLLYRRTTGILWEMSMFDIFLGTSLRL
jgi:hypothetical protein